ncbi:hypothetical protein FGG78_23385 [Thioclava sp. BHET1]|nr:hypothetical protein FGG78_23385 [Thioclava sp. BHET1]
MHKALLLIPLALALGACASPRAQCVDQASHDLRVVDGLIAQLQTNIARGYGTKTYVTSSPDIRACGAVGFWRGPGYFAQPGFCYGDVPERHTVAVPIDIDQAKRQLAELKRKRVELEARTADALSQCNALYPQSPKP